nr:DUF2782 domain-containing protein [Zoogloeaceae bacterium]
MRSKLITLLALMALSGPSLAQQQALEPIPEPPPLPPGTVDEDESLEPEVTITQRGEDTVEEFRIRGRLYMVKVTPPHGVPYFLVDQTGSGTLVPFQSALPTLSVPMWIIRSW